MILFALSNIDGGITATVTEAGRHFVVSVTAQDKVLDRFYFADADSSINFAQVVVL